MADTQTPDGKVEIPVEAALKVYMTKYQEADHKAALLQAQVSILVQENASLRQSLAEAPAEGNAEVSDESSV